MSSRSAVLVVAAVVLRDGRYLVTRRQAGTHLAGFWEFPGGKVDAGEAEADALVREIGEELGVGCAVGPLILRTTHDYPERSVTLAFYACTLTGDPSPVLGQDMRWVEPGALRELEFPPADEELIALLSAG
ncbi:MAG: (deoxy)nucleoside triphosphate pyrophosphohydrolase [Vicinamibacterales bacterium]